MPEARGVLPPTATHIGFVGTSAGMTAQQLCSVYALLLRSGSDEENHVRCVGDIVHPPKPDDDRYRDIVQAVGLLIAAPRSVEVRIAGHTWTTAAHAVQRGRPVVIVSPTDPTVRVDQRC